MIINVGIRKLFILGLIMVSIYAFSLNKAIDTYPIPAKTDKLLFYLQRSKNKNTIIYELNTLPDGTLNQEEPIHPYWLRYEEGGKKMELSYIQNKLAFGIDAVLADKQRGDYILTMVSYKNKSLLLQKQLINNKYTYRVIMLLNGKLSELQSIFVNAVDNLFGYPKVESIELFGIDLKSCKKVYEKIIPY